MASTQFFPASESIAVNGVPNNTVRFEDLNVDKMVWATVKTWTQVGGVSTPVFELWYQETNALKLSQYLFPRDASQDISVFLAIVLAEASDENFTKYTNWIRYNRRDIGTAKDIIINDSFITRKIFRIDANETDLYVGVRQALEDQIFTVEGDQEKAKNYYYTYGQ